MAPMSRSRVIDPGIQPSPCLDHTWILQEFAGGTVASSHGMQGIQEAVSLEPESVNCGFERVSNFLSQFARVLFGVAWFAFFNRAAPHPSVPRRIRETDFRTGYRKIHSFPLGCYKIAHTCTH